MTLRSRLRSRECEQEEIDDPELKDDLLQGALRGLARINSLSRSANIVWLPLVSLARQLKTDRLRILDVATGAGDIPLALWRKARKSGVRLEIHGVDVNERALTYARNQADARGADIQFSRMDAIAEEFPRDYDVVISSLFLHHLPDESIARLLNAMAEAAHHMVLINDLRRHPFGLGLAHLAGSVLTRSPVVRVDAVRSVRAAFTLSEARDLAARAGLNGAVVSRRWPCRFLLSWRRSPVA